MGANSKIPWTDDTFNPWWGCQVVKDSPECDHCYARDAGHRFGTHWGPKTLRRFFGDKHWNEPRRWDRKAAKEGVRRRVFCGSMCDVFEDRFDLLEHRARLWALIRHTPNLDWLLLTKRPENFAEMLPWLEHEPPWSNVWLGVTTGCQRSVDVRIPLLLSARAVVRFVSCEPILEELRLETSLQGDPHVDWVICGDESGRKRRAAELDWARGLRDQCLAAEVPFFFKQWHVPSLLRGGRDYRVVKIECPELDGVVHQAFPG